MFFVQNTGENGVVFPEPLPNGKILCSCLMCGLYFHFWLDRLAHPLLFYSCLLVCVLMHSPLRARAHTTPPPRSLCHSEPLRFARAILPHTSSRPVTYAHTGPHAHSAPGHAHARTHTHTPLSAAHPKAACRGQGMEVILWHGSMIIFLFFR